MVSYGNTFSGTAVTLTGATGTTVTFRDKVTGDSVDRLTIDANGKCNWGPGNGAADVNLYRGGVSTLQTDSYFVIPNGQTNGSFAVFGGSADSLKVGTAGGGVAIKEGSNARSGVSTLVAGTVTVANTSVSATTRIQLTAQALGTVAAPKALAVTARSAGTSFTITSADATDTSSVAWLLIEPA